jgi:hypothetical protein
LSLLSFSLNFSSFKQSLKKNSLEEETNGEEEKEEVSGVKKGDILWGLPHECVDDYEKWLKITLYFKQFGSYEDWQIDKT